MAEPDELELDFGAFEGNGAGEATTAVDRNVRRTRAAA